MKSFFTLVTTAFISLSGYAYFDQTKLTISSAGNTSIRIMVDGKKYTNKNSDVVISNLNPGYHTVKIFVLKQQRNRDNERWQPIGNQSTYQLVYNSSINIKQQYHTDIIVNRFGKVYVDEQQITYSAREEDEDNWGDDGNGGGGNYNQQMTAQVFEQFKQTIRKESFDDTKMAIVKQVASTNWFTTAQVKEVLQLFTFESNKLDVAKYMYKYTLDKGSYFLINDVFVFSSNKEELMKYIQTVR